MELRDYLRIARRRWLLILTCLVLAVGGAAAVTFQMTPQYASSTRLFVSTTESDASAAYTGGLFSAQRVTSYADLTKGQELASRVIADLELDVTPAELSETVSARVVPETVLLEVTVTDPSPMEAQRIAASYAGELIAFIDELETPPGLRVAPIKATTIDAATLPTSPVSPQPVRNLSLAAILGLLAGLGAAVLRELLDTSVKSATDVAEAAGNAPVMGSIAYDSDAAKQPLITALDSHAPRVEAFRMLRTNLQFVDVDHDSKVFTVTSSVPGEGKTTTATNMAVALAQAGQRVVLVEGDLRRGHIAELLGLERSVGLTTVLVGRIDLVDAVQDSAVPGLSVLTSGAVPPNPAELLQSQAMHDVLARLRKAYDIVVVDAPPLLPVTDAALLAAQSEGALLVVRHSRTTRDQLAASAERLGAVDAKIIGVVLNMVPRRGSGEGYGYGYGYEPQKARRRKAAVTDGV